MQTHPDTAVVAAGRPQAPGAPLNVSPVLASNYRLPSERVYARASGTDTTAAFESLMGELEGGIALAFGSGMAAVSAVLDRLDVGSTVLVPDHPYHGVEALLSQAQRQRHLTVRRIDQADTAAWVEQIPHADLVWLETPENPLLTVADLPRLCSVARPPSTLVVVDSTFATPLLQSPLSYGADVVLHSASKFIGGHSDLLAGALVMSRHDIADELRERRSLLGASLGSLETFLAVRGARTLSVRMERAQANAAELVARLERHRQVSTVRYPGLPTHPTHEVAASFMTGFGTMVSFDTAGTVEQCAATCEAVGLIVHATSLGGVETTMERRAALAGQQRIPPTLIRLSVGIEHIDDLWRDLDTALVTAHR